VDLSTDAWSPDKCLEMRILVNMCQAGVELKDGNKRAGSIFKCFLMKTKLKIKITKLWKEESNIIFPCNIKKCNVEMKLIRFLFAVFLP